jgi:hypothetical protein
MPVALEQRELIAALGIAATWPLAPRLHAREATRRALVQLQDLRDPGGNVAGLLAQSTHLVGKRFEGLREVVHDELRE